MYQHFSELSLWEISHYWHGVKPDSTSPKSLPLEVEGTLRALAASSSKSLYFRCPPNSIYCHAFTDSNFAVSAITRILQNELRRAYQLRRFNKKFLDGLTISRVALTRWCLQTKTSLPEFWFPPDDPLRSKTLNQLNDISALSKNGKYVLFSMSGNDYISLSSGEDLQTASSDLNSIPSQKSAINEAISMIAKKNAHARYQSLYEIKRNFIRYHHTHSFKTKAQAAGNFFCTLSEQEKLELVPSFVTDIAGSDTAEEKAIRTLTTALREYTSEKAVSWLEGFTL